MAENNVVEIGCVTYLDIPAEKLLEAAKDAKLKHVIIIGECEDGDEYFASSTPDGPLAVWMLERAKLEVLYMVDDDDEEDD